MTTIHHSPPPGATPFAIYEDPEDQESPSPSEEGDMSFTSELSLSGADVALPSIEGEHDLQEEPEPYSGSYTSRSSILSSSRRDSTMTENSYVSSLPSEISVASKPVPPANALESRYSPRRERPPFRNPSSVRAMQMASPPPLLAPEASRERMKGSYKLATPSRNGRSDSVSTTGTRRSRSHRDSLHREYQAQSPRLTATPQPLPLVLLHVTILPMQMPYAPDVMNKIMPEWLVENYKILEEKLQDIVLMRRGLLIQHPRDEYEVLEERILESLELTTPRLLKCGHFVGPDSDDEESPGDDERNVADDVTGRGSRMSGMSGGTVTAEEDAEFRYPTPNSDDASMCVDCHRQVKKPGHGVGAGTKRWDIKIYAANGLMRAGAWAAAWSEMERCDVEISPWIPNEVRKTVEKRLEQEREAAKMKALYAAELKRQMDEEAALQRKHEEEEEARRRLEEAELQKEIEAEAAVLQKKLEEEAAEKRQLEQTLNEKIEEAKEAIRLEFEAQALSEANCVAERFRAMEQALKVERERVAAQAPPVLQVPRISSRSCSRSRHQTRSRSRRPRVEEIPLGTLLKNYFALQLQDTRNFFILILGALVVFLLMNSNPNWNPHQPALDLAVGIPLNDVSEPIVPVVVTSTATMTATSFSTLVVTEVLTPENAQGTLSPSSSDATAVEEEEFSTSHSSKEEPSSVAVLTGESDGGAENGNSADVILKGLAERLVTEDEDATTTDEITATDTESESVASLESLEPTVETTPAEEVSAPTESESSSIPVEEFSSITSATEELVTPLESALPAGVPNEEEGEESGTQPGDPQQSEGPQVDGAPTLSEITSSTEPLHTEHIESVTQSVDSHESEEFHVADAPTLLEGADAPILSEGADAPILSEGADASILSESSSPAEIPSAEESAQSETQSHGSDEPQVDDSPTLPETLSPLT